MDPTTDLSPPAAGRPFHGRGRTFVRRALFFTTVALVNAAACLWLADSLWGEQFRKAHFPLLAVFVVLNGLLTDWYADGGHLYRPGEPCALAPGVPPPPCGAPACHHRPS